MRILQVITRGELGGGQRHVVDLLEGLRGRHEVELATGEEGYLMDAATAMGVRVHKIPHLLMPMSPWNDMLGLLELRHLVARLKPDLVHTHTSKAGILGRTAAALNGVPCLFTAHTWCFAEGTSWKWKAIGIPLEKLAALWSGAIINVSDANRNLALARGITSPGKLITVHNGIPDTPHRSQPGAGVVPAVVMVARFAPQKAQAELIKAAAGLNVPYRLQFIGDGVSRPANEELAASLGIRDRVEFLGVRSDVPQILAKANIFALPTNWEGFPLTILEGMRAGLPVIASDVGGVREAVTDGLTGFVIPPNDTLGFRSKLESLLTNPALRAKMGASGRARYERDFTVQAMLEKTIAIYESVCAKVTYVVPETGSPSSITPERN